MAPTRRRHCFITTGLPGSPSNLGLDAGDGVIGLWTDGTTVYFITVRAFGSYSAADGVASFPAGFHGGFTSIAGNAARGEVYVTAVDTTFASYACGPTMALVYDGASLRRF